MATQRRVFLANLANRDSPWQVERQHEQFEIRLRALVPASAAGEEGPDPSISSKRTIS